MPILIPDFLSRPADVSSPPGAMASQLLEIHVISPLQQQTLGEAASISGHALQVGVQRKLGSHLSACRAVGVEFVPFIMESLGSLAKDSISILHSLGKAIELAPRSLPLRPQSVPSSSFVKLPSHCGGKRHSLPSPLANSSSFIGWSCLIVLSCVFLLYCIVLHVVYCIAFFKIYVARDSDIYVILYY